MRLIQPDRRSCGAACLVMARRLRDPAYASHTRDSESFGAAVLDAHRAITRACRSSLGWPRAIGTPPWILRRELATMTGMPYAIRVVRGSGDLGWGLLSGASPHRPHAVYVGSDWLPRHVVLVLDADSRRARIYDPAAGLLRTVGRDAWIDGSAGLGGWGTVWLVIRPGPPTARRSPA